jgi:hypothetical protein
MKKIPVVRNALDRVLLELLHSSAEAAARGVEGISVATPEALIRSPHNLRSLPTTTRDIVRSPSPQFANVTGSTPKSPRELTKTRAHGWDVQGSKRGSDEPRRDSHSFVRVSISFMIGGCRSIASVVIQDDGLFQHNLA